MRLICKSCGSELSRDVTLGQAVDALGSFPAQTEREPLTGRGCILRSNLPWVTQPGAVMIPHLGHVPIDFLNPSDVLDTVRLTKKGEFLNGCCGLDGCDGPNQLCACGIEIGTLMDDCWTPHAFVPDPAKTKWMLNESNPETLSGRGLRPEPRS